MPKSVVIRKRRRREQSSPIKATENETDAEDSGSSDNDEHYRRKYCFLKKMAKTMIYVSVLCKCEIYEQVSGVFVSE